MINVNVGDKIEVELFHLEKKPVWIKATVTRVNDYQIIYTTEIDGNQKHGAVAREGSAQGWRIVKEEGAADGN